MPRIAAAYDVVVAGGGSAGVAAAVGAARCGARTLLVERYGFLGGAATTSNVLTYCGFYRQDERIDPVVGGVATDLLRRLAALGQDVAPRRSRSGNWILAFDPEALKFALDGLVAVPGLDVALHAFMAGAAVQDGNLRAVTIADHSGLREIVAGAFVDATGESDLARRAGLAAHPLRSGAAVLQPASFPVRVGGVPASTEITADFLREVADAMRAAHPHLPVRADGGVHVRLPHSGDLWWTGIDSPVDGADCGSQTDAEVVGRRTAQAWIAILRRQLGFGSAFVATTGPQFGIRETPHVHAEAMASAEAASAGLTRPDGIARAGWPMEVHAEAGKPVYRRIGGGGYFDVPYGAICAAGLNNLWLAGRTIGSDAQAYGSVRVMGTAFATGHAAGIAAALDPRRAGRLPAIRTELQAQGALV